MKTRISDTTPEAEAFLIERIQQQTVAERIARVFELNELCRLFALADLRRAFPHADEDELRLRLFARLLPPEIFNEVYGALPKDEKS